MTDTAQLADIVLPATMCMEHDDIYRSGGHTHLMLGLKLRDAPGSAVQSCRAAWLAKRLGADHAAFDMTERAIIDATLHKSGRGTLADLEAGRWLDCAPAFEDAHYLSGFAHNDGKYRFRPDWADETLAKPGSIPARCRRLATAMPKLPDSWPVIDLADDAHPFRLVTAPARTFLNSTFTETPGSRARERRPELRTHPDDARSRGLKDGQCVRVGNEQGEVLLHLRLFAGVRLGVVIAEGIWANDKHERRVGINTLTSAAAAAPVGGAAFHDTHVWVSAPDIPLEAARSDELAAQAFATG